MKKIKVVNKIFALVVSLVMMMGICAITQRSKETATAEATVLYEQNFNGLSELPSDWAVASSNPNGTIISVSNGVLNMQNLTTISPIAVYYNGDVGANYTIEADFNMLEVSDQARWVGIAFRVQETDGWYKASYGINDTYSINNYTKTSMSGGSYVQLTSGTLFDDLQLNNSYKLSVTVYGQKVSMSINGSYVANTEIPQQYASGGFGIVMSGAKITVDNVKVYKATQEGQSWVSTTIDTYIPQTGIVNPPIVVANGTNGTKPATASIAVVNDDGSVSLGQTKYNSIQNYLSNLNAKTIPIYKVGSSASAQSLTTYLENNFTIDAFVLVNEQNVQLLNRVFAKNRYIRGVMEVEGQVTTTAQAWDICKKANTYGANVVLLENATQEVIFYMQRHMLTVWLTSSNIATVHNAIMLGANGIVTQDVDSVYDYYASFIQTTVIRRPVINAHRGGASLYTQNTLNAFITAYQRGANMIEIDLYLTKDKHIVLFHDGNLDGLTNGTGAIENYTLAELKKLTVDCKPEFKETIPSLEEVMQYFKNTDVMFMLELKSNQAEMMYVLRTLLEKYDFFDNVVSMSGNLSQIKLSRQIIPEIVASRGGLSDVINPIANDLDSISATIKDMGPYHYQPFPYWYNTNDGTWSYLYKFAARGWLSYSSTCNDASTYDQRNLTVFGSTSALSDNSHYAMDYIYYLNAEDTQINLADLNQLSFQLVGNDGSFPTTVKCQTLNGQSITQAGEYQAVCYTDVTLPRTYGNSITYRLYSKTFTLTVN